MARHALLLIALLPLAACGDVNHAATDYTQSNDRIATSGNDEPLKLAPVVAGSVPWRGSLPPPLSPPSSALVSLSPDTTATLRGSVRLTSAGAATWVRTALAGGSPFRTYEGSVRRGLCTAIGSNVAPLMPVSVDSAGAGSSSSRIGVPMDSLWSAPHVIAFGPGGRPVTCGSISGAPAPPPPAPPGEAVGSDTLSAGS